MASTSLLSGRHSARQQVLYWLLGVIVIHLNQLSRCVSVTDNGLGYNETLQSSNRSLIACGHNTSSDSYKMPLYFLVLAPYPDTGTFAPGWAGGPAIVPGALVARDLINKREDILEDYELLLLVEDSGCDVVTKAVINFTSSVFYCGKNIVGIIGPGCSEATISIAAPFMSDSRLSLLQIAATASSPTLTNTTRFPNTFLPLVSSLGMVDTYIELIRRKNYRHIGVIYESERIFQTTVYTHFATILEDEGVQLTSFGLINVQFPVDEFRNKIRIIFVFGGDDFVHNLLCFIFNEQLMYPDYQFFFSERKPSNYYVSVSFSLDGTLYECSVEDMKHVVRGMVFSKFRLTRLDKEIITDVGISYSTYHEEYSEALNLHLQSLGLAEAIDTEHHTNYFDSTWALALSLNNSLPRLEERNLSLLNYMYGMPEITEIVREELLALSFEGMRGRVEFSNETHDGSNVTIIDLFQILDIANTENFGRIGYYNPLAAVPFYLYNNESLLRQDDFDILYITPHLSLGVLEVVAVSVLFVALFACQIAYVLWGSHKTVKATSPNLNHLIFSGCYLSLFGAIIYTSAFVFFDASSANSSLVIPVHCSGLQWSCTMTYSLVFGTLCAKRWRVYRIFNDFTSSKMKHLGDEILLFVSLLPVAVDVVVNVLWNIIDPWYFYTKPPGRRQQIVATCKINHELVWALCVAVPKVVLTVIVLYITLATRRIQKKEFRQTKSINILIYSLLVLTGIFLPMFFILQLTVSLWAVSLSFVSISLFQLAFVMLCIIFVLLPPLIAPIKEKIQSFCKH